MTPTQSYSDLQGYYSSLKFYILSLFFNKRSSWIQGGHGYFTKKWLERKSSLWRVCWHLTKDLICCYLLECIVEVCVRKCSTPSLSVDLIPFVCVWVCNLKNITWASFPVALLLESHFWHIQITILRMSIQYVKAPVRNLG